MPFTDIQINAAAKYLKPLREQIIELIPEKAKVLELGCGGGHLLFEASDRISYGLGIDISKRLISQANQKNLNDHLHFECQDITAWTPDENYDAVLASLFLHIIPWRKAVHIMQNLKNVSDHMIIAGFDKPKSWAQRFLLFVDQRFSDHYPYFKAYQENGGIESLAEASGWKVSDRQSTFDKSVFIYILKKRES